MDKRFWGFLVVIAVILGAVFFITNTHKAAAPSENTKGTLTNHIYSKGSTGVTLVEYGDFQCPACGQYYAPVKQAVETYKDRVTFQFRNFPLSQIHPNALAGARAAEAADQQGKYWQMHDLLYENQESWTSVSDPFSVFASFAKSLGLDAAKFQTDFKSRLANDRVQADVKEGNRLGVDATPTFFLDGKKVSNPDPSTAGFAKILDAEIAKKAGSATPSPTPAPSPEPTPTPEATPAP